MRRKEVMALADVTLRVSAPGYRTLKEQRLIAANHGELEADFILEREEAAR